MACQQSIHIGLLGAGTVGTGVVEAISRKNRFIEDQIGCNIIVDKILVSDLSKKRTKIVSETLLTTDPQEILNDPNIDLVVELIGGEHPALDYIKQSLSSGKSVVTANKEVMAKHGSDLITLAEQNGKQIFYEASVGGGIPIIGPLTNDLRANEIHEIRAIINGTTNYILTKMATEDLEFSQALAEAQELGYAENDPANDIEGIDAAYKLAILANLAFRTKITEKNIYREGITKLTSKDFRYASELGYSIKLVATAKIIDQKLEARVHPVFIPNEMPLAKIDGVLNAIELDGDLSSKVLFQGSGAGSLPTTSAVLGNIISACESIHVNNSSRKNSIGNQNLEIRPIEDLVTKYYLRVNVSDKPGVMGQMAAILGNLQISIASVIQKESDPEEKTAELVITTHPSRDQDIQMALFKLANLDAVKEIGNIIRIEE